LTREEVAKCDAAPEETPVIQRSVLSLRTRDQANLVHPILQDHRPERPFADELPGPKHHYGKLLLAGSTTGRQLDSRCAASYHMSVRFRGRAAN